MIETIDTCVFCYENARDKIIATHNSVFAIKDSHPVSEGHYLIIPKRHSADFFSLTQTEKADADALVQILRKNLLSEDKTITGFNIGTNAGESAGQTIFHCHIHLIPRRDGDTPAPRGGVRGVIPEKMGY